MQSRSENNDVTSTSAFDDINKNVEEKLPESENTPPETKPELPDVTSDTPSGKSMRFVFVYLCYFITIKKKKSF